MTSLKSSAPGYGQYCPIATALDMVGERWTLLILRDLAHGPLRYTDIQSANPGLSPNLLSRRLTQLRELGLVERRELPPPGRASVYDLTEHGRTESVPLLKALARFGAGLLPDVRVDLEKLLAGLRSRQPGVISKNPAVRESYLLVIGDVAVGITVGPGQFDVSPEPPDRPAATVRTSMKTMSNVFASALTIDMAVEATDMTIQGDRAAVTRLVSYLSFAADQPSSRASTPHPRPA